MSPGDPKTLIAGMPAARVSDMVVCVGPPDTIIMGSFVVLIGGRAAARMGDSCAHGGTIVAGCPTVLIGDSGGAGSPQAATMSAARASAQPFAPTDCPLKGAAGHQDPGENHEPTEVSWVEISLVDEAGAAVPYERYRVIASNGRVREGFLNAHGVARVAGIPAGNCQITFPSLDRDTWHAG